MTTEYFVLSRVCATLRAVVAALLRTDVHITTPTSAKAQTHATAIRNDRLRSAALQRDRRELALPLPLPPGLRPPRRCTFPGEASKSWKFEPRDGLNERWDISGLRLGNTCTSISVCPCCSGAMQTQLLGAQP